MADRKLMLVLFHLFSWLLNGLGAVGLLTLVLVPLGLTWQTYGPHRTPAYPTRVQYDTSLRADVVNIGFDRVGIDGRGRHISRVSAENGHLNYYDEDNRLRQHYPLDSLRRMLQSSPDQLPAALRRRVLADRQQQNRQVDSILRADPDARIVRLPDRWVRQPMSGSGFGWMIQVSVWSGTVFNPRTQSFSDLTNWNRLVSERPYAELRPQLNRELPYALTVSIRRWSDLTRPVWPLAILSLLGTLLWFLVPGAVLQWLREILADLLTGSYFAPAITTRFRRIGWAFVGMFFGQNLLDTLKPLAARSYLDDRYFYGEKYPLFYIGHDHWLWLFVGLMTLVLARIFQYGTQLQREQDLTI